MARATILQPITLGDLPEAIFTRIADHLECPARALFAVAVPWEGPSGAVASSFSPCAVLDFGEMEKGTAAKLSDEDVRDVLLKIDAPNNLTTLKLLGCTGITGSGLAPLTGSGAIKIVDLVVNEEGESISLPSLSADAILPIISSIVEVWRNETHSQPRHSRVVSERYLDLPTSFLGPNASPVVQQFMGTYSQNVLTAVLHAPKPKRPMSSFFLYSCATRDDVKAANPDASFGQVARILAINFRALPEDELDFWHQKGAEDRDRYQREMTRYLQRKRLRFNSYHTGGVAFRNR